MILGSGNLFSTFVLLIWPLFCVGFFVWLPPVRAVAVTYTVGALYLPQGVAIKLPFLPALDKFTLTYVCCWLCGSLLSRPKLRLPAATAWLALLYVVVATCTFLANRDPQFVGGIVLPGLVLRDALASALETGVRIVLPLGIGMATFRTPDDIRELFRVALLGALSYMPLIAAELVLSPQMHRWVYGFHQHEFLQSVRGGGYRPLVFTSHGLALTGYLLQVSIVAKVLNVRVFGTSGRFWSHFLLGVIAICNSVGALVFGLLSLALTSFLGNRGLTRVAVVFGVILVSYPVLRANDWVPVDELVAWFTDVAGKDRAGSLQFRFHNEALLLERALERPYFGWGGYGRQHVFEWGHAITIIDGLWIGFLGNAGFFGWGVFGLIVLTPLFAVLRMTSHIPASDQQLLATAVFMLSLRWLDLIPNSSFTGDLIMLSGGIISTVALLKTQHRRR